MAKNRPPDSPSASAPPPAAPDGLFDAPQGRQPGDDSEDEPEARASRPGATRPNGGASTAIVPQTEERGAFVGPERSAIARRSTFGQEVEYSKESLVVAARVKAEIAARTLHALNHPRSFFDARRAILDDCKRKEFAKVAIYRKPVGGGFVEGLSIRAVEAMMARWGNIYSDAVTTLDEEEKRVVHISVTDLETNTTHGRDITIPKTTETLTLKPGQEAFSQRINSQGRVTYTVRPTEDKLSDIEASHRSKVLRNEGLRLIPPDIKEEVLALCKLTRGSNDAADPGAARKEIADAFAGVGVMPSRLEEFLGCPLAETAPTQLSELRDVYRAIKDGDATFRDFMEARVSDIAPTDEDGEQPVGSAVAMLTAKAREKAAERKAGKP
jgi:Txe/YoeB family toxin of Txe-Axe toxin-antitoxin module